MRLSTVLALLVLIGAAAAGYVFWQERQSEAALKGFAVANGRIEVERVAVATKYAGRVAEILVDEGDLVKKGDVVARMDTAELQAELAEAEAGQRQAEQGIDQAQAEIGIRKADLALAEIELTRASTLQKKDAGTAAEVDRRRAQRDVAVAALKGAEAGVEDARAATLAAAARVARLATVIADMDLKAPTDGRVEYRLVKAGEVLAAGGQVATLLDLADVHMVVFFPTSVAGRVGIGSEARIVLDAAPEFVVPAKVSFVAAEAQFTPKFVETKTERDKLTYRIKVAIDHALLVKYRDYVKAGLTGNAYLKVEADAAWPDFLTVKLPPPSNGIATDGGGAP
ncbi:HlyD family secretion protein [Dongia rigui]|uniref:HlyD family efflux transporter periplasmic adaptor subunit n=1 Tax=Dongia rigui TaxID=940149 RepID=A0ABU5E4X7_9PROT|nr:HlyD family efflux transporter periplasmic adaptor subunit [Dongia rigui]MDY0873931.1 HlyD family efflux transporter periplasmic adaptor subunit [Dongia rigui]